MAKKIITITIICIFIIGCAVLAAFEIGLFHRTKSTPDLLNMKLEEAEKIAEDEGFVIMQGRDVYSSEFAEGRICSQEPEPGVMIKTGETIKVNLSKGEQKGTVPSVIGLGEEEAKSLLANNGYSFIEERVLSNSAEKETVIEQVPTPGTTFDKESKIIIVISGGDELGN